MKTIYGFVVVVAFCVGLIQLSGCGGEPEPDPCKNLAPVTADFFIYESFALPVDGWKDYDTDTLTSDYVYFEAKEKDATYEWILGAETITTRSFSRFNFPRGELLDVSLKVTKTPNQFCFPNDDGVDFKERKFYMTPDFWCGSLLNGTFRGADEDTPANVRDVTFEICAPNVLRPDLGPELRINNLVPGCNIFKFSQQPGHRQLGFWKSDGTGCLLPEGVAKLDSLSNNRIAVSYSILKSPQSLERVNKKFIGNRIN
jgi:hypothetical protein